MRVSLSQEPWESDADRCSKEIAFCLGPIVSATEKTLIKCNGRKLPVHSECNIQDAKEIKYTLPFITSVSGNGSLPLNWDNESVSFNLSGCAKYPKNFVVKDNDELDRTQNSLAFINEAISLFDELHLCAQFRAGKKTAGAGLFSSLIDSRKDDYKRGSFNWRELPWKIISQLVLEASKEPRYELIVRIAQEFSEELDTIANNPRKILRRIRKKTNLSRVQQMDAACLAWLVRQPGRSAIEKAGAAQEIYSIVREEFYDTLENRVLKHFILLCIRYSRDYLNRNKDFKSSDRFLLVQRFNFKCKSLSQNSIFGEISALNQIPQPNFVLQSDPLYSKLWDYYLQILHREKELESLWLWQHLLWADIMKLFISSAIYDLDRSNEVNFNYMHESNACINQKSDYGTRMLSSSWPKGIISEIDSSSKIILDCFSSQELNKSGLPQPIREIASKSGAAFFCYFSNVGGQIKEDLLLSIWVFHGEVLEEQVSTVDNQCARAVTALSNLKSIVPNSPKLRGLILRSTIKDQSSDILAAEVKDIIVEGLKVSIKPSAWRHDLLPIISQLIGECLLSTSESK